MRWTSYGIPHVRASDWGGLGYGYGYAFARDNLCTLAQDVVESTGQLSRFFGPGGGNLQSDAVWALFNSDAVAAESFAQLDSDMQELVRGYAFLLVGLYLLLRRWGLPRASAPRSLTSARSATSSASSRAPPSC